MTQQLVTVAEAAEILRVHPCTVRRYLASGVIRGGRRVGPRNIRIPKEEVLALYLGASLGGAA
ncbi:helix-turn-helix domain-containing protein [Mycobacterium sp. 1245852.3]|uniref:helix-turn-helix domain-containing protein n=1 Tax=Mycobacterium sp. 1245852.3 TaxID=1856860 RepID=UPI00082B7873|nr:helix-turn-helix domain-containing protein [Mycobacterium sp. 1245852.3]